MKLILLLIVALFISNAVSGQCPQIFMEYVDVFKEQAKYYRRSLPVDGVWVKCVGEDLYINGIQLDAYCDFSNRVIVIDTTSYTWLEDRFLLVMHELGHYYLKREHDSVRLSNGKPKSIMTTPFDISFREESSSLQGYYMRELFSN